MRLCFSVMNVANPVQITKDKDPQETGAIALTNLDAFILGVICHREPNITYSPWLSVCALQDHRDDKVPEDHFQLLHERIQARVTSANPTRCPTINSVVVI